MASGLHDRRGFDSWLRMNLVLLVLSLMMIFVNWKLGLASFLFLCITFISSEAASAPPANSPDQFEAWVRRKGARKPVLLCLGDSLTHGTVSSSFTPDIPYKLSSTLGLSPPTQNFFMDPLWVVNAGQNCITTHGILHERLHRALGCFPDFVLIMIGTNDMQCLVNGSLAKAIVKINKLPEVPTMEIYERNLTKIIDYIHNHTPQTQIGVCTLPPMGENLDANPNRIVRQANEVIERVVKKAPGKVTLIPVYSRFESILEKKSKKSGSKFEYHYLLSSIQVPLFYMIPAIFDWNRLASLCGNTLLVDGLHLSEKGRDELVNLIVEWLLSANVAKAIAVKN
ncbi:hypothetical protein FisN_10Lh232 [Fistulifera solaris]|uniref:SGNH hydrolase-type esterase domain-containing protein n=1 Tax=Fistulifera solaris TaxID=1519565 RepID=A0A1Z5JTV4_FISSO|nr:hypothetical protein FisN_10Lh232 [Fistulifera solaris]|eukprot:GAX17359.1 hypothetical protein FisN_10Lh232 [Fistulifera solaris]